MADLYLTPAERYTAALGGFYYGDLPEPGTVYTQLIKDILNGTTPEKEPKNILARFIYSLYISDLGDPYPRYELAKLLYWKLHDITPTKSGSILTVTIDGKEDYMTINTDLSRLWYKVLFGSKTDVITDFPYIFNTMQNKLSDWELFGNVEVSGTPTPDNPVMPDGCGERTGNLFDESTIIYGKWTNSAGSAQGYGYGARTVDISASVITIKIYGVLPYSFSVCWLDSNKGFIERWHEAKPSSSNSYTLNPPQNASYFYLQIANGTDSTNTITAEQIASYQIMLNYGSTALPYEPYGYKIPISLSGTTNNVYLGEVQTTRKVKKLVLTGEETWTNNSNNACCVLFLSDIGLWTRKYNPLVKCSYVPTAQQQADLYNRLVDYGITFGSSSADRICIRNKDCEPVADFKNWLRQQYAAGTPVCVWYVLANEETTVVNEPLMKIGEYADSLSMAQTGIDIPTVIGQNTLDVLTTVKPSSMRIEYTSADETRSRSKRISLLKSPLKKGLIK